MGNSQRVRHVVSEFPKDDAGRRPPRAEPVQPARDDHQLRVVCRRLRTEVRTLRAEVARRRDENADLREAARLWLLLYERQLARANHILAQLRRPKGDQGWV
jgi:hypothetical protein